MIQPESVRMGFELASREDCHLCLQARKRTSRPQWATCTFWLMGFTITVQWGNPLIYGRILPHSVRVERYPCQKAS